MGNKVAKGGLTKGKSHKEGGIPMRVKSTGQNIEVEGGEIIINKYSSADTKKHNFDGEQLTKCEIASKINEADDNGVKIDCDTIVGKKYKYNTGGKIKGNNMDNIEINAIVDNLKKGDKIVLNFGSAISPNNSVELKVRSRNKVRKGTIDKITFDSIKNPQGRKFYAYNRGNDKWGFAMGDMAISNISITKSYAEGGKTDNSIAITILKQLGGVGRLRAFTGAYNFIALKDGVAFRIKNRRVNHIKIILNAKDLYDMQFIRIRGVDLKVVKEYNDIYFDQLIPLFEETTGMYLSFAEGGKLEPSLRPTRYDIDRFMNLPVEEAQEFIIGQKDLEIKRLKGEMEKINKIAKDLFVKDEDGYYEDNRKFDWEIRNAIIEDLFDVSERNSYNVGGYLAVASQVKGIAPKSVDKLDDVVAKQIETRTDPMQRYRDQYAGKRFMGYKIID